MYILVNYKKKTGYKGIRLSNDNLSTFSERLLLIWEKAGIIKKEPSIKPKKDGNTTT